MPLLYLVTSIALAATPPPPNVVLLSVDTLRADYLGYHGHTYPTSPNLDALADRSLVFEDMICEVPLTGPSFASMFSSQYPRTTGTTRNGLRLPDAYTTITELFQAAGYETVCVQSNWTLKSKLSGLDRGFDRYDDDFHKKRWGLIKSERPGDEVTQIALKMLKNRDKSKPLFAWFHWSDPHAPYKLHSKFDVARALRNTDGEDAEKRREYNSEVAFTDRQIARVLDALPAENTYIVFLADHGESLGEHDYVGHGRRLYQPGAHIPFMVSGPTITPGRTEVPGRGIDIGTTLLGLAGLEPATGMLGVDLIADPPDASRPRVVETYGGAVPGIPGVKQIMAEADAMMRAAYLEGWKLILDDGKTELYHLPVDPMELSDLSEHYPDRVAQLRQLIEDWERITESTEGEEAALSDDDIEALRSLGYVQ